MRQIFSWTIGSFFRTIGRTLALLGMGALLYFILSKLGFGVKDLFLENVKAESYTSGTWGNYWRNSSTKLEYESGKGYYTTQATSFPVYLFFNNQISQSGGGLQLPTNATRVRFHLRISSYPVSPELAHIYNSYTVGTYYDKGGLTYCDTVQANNYNRNGETFTNQIDLTLDCPIVKTSSYLSVIFVRGVDSSSGYPFKIDINPNYTFEYDDASEGIQGVIDQQEQTNDKIEEQTQQQQQQHQEMMDTNMTETNETASSFFNNFSDNDHGGLSSIVTAPLVVVNKMLDGVCVQPSATWKGATISLPCGDMFWSRPGAIDLKNLLNIFYGGVVCYYAIRKLFLMIESLKDPTQDRIEVMDL